MDVAKRVQAIEFLTAIEAVAFSTARTVEAHCHAAAVCPLDYVDNVLRAHFNLRHRPDDPWILCRSDAELAETTVRGRIDKESAVRRKRFEEMLQEKYDAIDDVRYTPLERCRRCGGSDVSWEEKQVRSADEGMTVFCFCRTCRNRWKVS